MFAIKLKTMINHNNKIPYKTMQNPHKKTKTNNKLKEHQRRNNKAKSNRINHNKNQVNIYRRNLNLQVRNRCCRNQEQ